MADIGKFNTLKIVRFTENGAYLDASELGEILLPNRYVPAGAKAGDRIDVFLYLDSEDRLVATTDKPFAKVGEFAYLKVVSVNPVGAFLDWGLPKDLLVPFREQRMPMAEGRSYFVFLYLDGATRRIAASARLNKFMDPRPPAYEEGQEVDLLIFKRTDLGYSAIVDNAFWGTLYKNEVYEELEPGQRLKGYIKKIREDQKIDIRLYKPGPEKIGQLATRIVALLKDNEGFLAVTDNTPPEDIYRIFGASKRTFKKALGVLYKQRIVAIEENGIRLLD